MDKSINEDIRADIARVQNLAQVPFVLDVCQRVTGMGFVAVARVTDARWITCASLDKLGFGLGPGDELEIETTICDRIREFGEPVFFDDAAEDPVYAEHAAPRLYGFRSYISVPIFRRDGAFFGTLCAIDPEKRAIDTPEIRGMFRLFAELIALELQTADALEENRRALEQARETMRLREEFIGVVAHDLRNPVAAISSGLRMLESRRDPERDEMLFAELKKSVMRSNEMISNLLDFTKGRLDSAMTTDLQPGVDMAELVEAIAAEMRIASGHWINVEAERPLVFDCDAKRIRQLVSNLVGNAAHHGRAGAPITVTAREEGGEFVLTVHNEGDPIPEEMIPRVFAPFARGQSRHENGLGLGLYIVSQIAEAHRGTISVTSGDEGTAVTFRMPRAG